MANFDVVFDRLMEHEGGYSNIPRDAGGETHWGISKRSYPEEDIKKMTKERAKFLFKRDLWNKLQLNYMHDSIAYQLADFAYNSGPRQAILCLQRALGVTADGIFGNISKDALLRADEQDVIMLLNAERLEFFTTLSTWNLFGKGWARRIAKNLRYGKEDTLTS